MDKNLEIAYGIKEKVELYSLTLAFTLLAFSIQTGKFDPTISVVAQVTELCAWAFLFLSSLIGFWRIKFIAPLMSLYSEINRKRQEKNNLIEDIKNGATAVHINNSAKPIPAIKAEIQLDIAIANDNTKANRLSESVTCWGWAHDIGLLLGIVLLMFGRGYDPVLRLSKTLFP